MRCSSPVLTATSAASRLAPVANAFGCGESKIPTSGMPMPAARAWLATTPTSHCSVALPGWSMTRTPMDVLAIHFDRASEMNEPAKPKKAAKTSSPPRLLPWACSQRSSPIRWATTDSTRTMARLVARNSTMRFMAGLGTSGGLRGCLPPLDGGRGRWFSRRHSTVAGAGPPALDFVELRQPQGRAWGSAEGFSRFCASADGHPERAPDHKTHQARSAPDQHHAQGAPQGIAAGEQAQRQADGEQRRGRHCGSAHDRPHSGDSREERGERYRGPGGEG